MSPRLVGASAALWALSAYAMVGAQKAEALYPYVTGVAHGVLLCALLWFAALRPKPQEAPPQEEASKPPCATPRTLVRDCILSTDVTEGSEAAEGSEITQDDVPLVAAPAVVTYTLEEYESIRKQRAQAKAPKTPKSAQKAEPGSARRSSRVRTPAKKLQ